jgi:hypothetical protein
MRWPKLFQIFPNFSQAVLSDSNGLEGKKLETRFSRTLLFARQRGSPAQNYSRKWYVCGRNSSYYSRNLMILHP